MNCNNMNCIRHTTSARSGRSFFILFLLFSLPVSVLNAQVFEVDTVVYHGSPDTCINIVILGDGYLQSQLGQFSADAHSIVSALFQMVPFGNYRKSFNVYSIAIPSVEQGAADHPDSLIDNYFGSTFNFAGIDRLLVPTRESRVISVLADHFPQFDQVIMLVNTPKYGGSGGWVCTASLHPEVNELVFHELGHSFAGLSDEYWAGAIYAAESINMTRQTNLDLLRWRNWYGELGVGLYPHEESPEWYRPHQECKMRYLGKPYCAVCTEGIIERIHTMVSPVLAVNPVGGTISDPDSVLRFSVRLIRPEPNTLSRTWHLNGETLAQDSDTCRLSIDNLIPGSNLVEVMVEDTTGMLRVDAHEAIHLYRVSWTILHSDTGSVAAQPVFGRAGLEIFPNPTAGLLYISIPSDDNGRWQAELYNTDGAKIIHAFPVNGERYPMNMEHLPSGTYVVRISRNGTPVTSRPVIRQ
jgi:hypothetical protein